MEFISLIMANVINPIEADAPNFIGQMIGWLHGLVGNFGVAVILFSVFLKLITLPLDIWQRVSAKKTSLVMTGLKDEMARIDEQFANDQRRANMEKQKLQKDSGMSTLSSCLPLIVTLGLFMFMFYGLRSYSTYSNLVVYNKLVTEYNQAFSFDYCDGEGDWLELYSADSEIITDTNAALKKGNLTEVLAALREVEADYPEFKAELETIIAESGTDLTVLRAGVNGFVSERKEYFNTKTAEANAYAQKTIGENFPELGENFLWINNVFQPDSWKPIFPDYETSGVDGLEEDMTASNAYTMSKKDGYEKIYSAITEYNPGYFGKGWNGLMILPIMSILLIFLSSWISQKMTAAKSGFTDEKTKQTSKMMMFIMPIMIAFFVFTYTASFAIYMVTNSLLSLLFTLVLNPYIEKRASVQVAEKAQKEMPSYSKYKRK
ncbi:MAG: membrane protein insertase YidC [Clostridia bacterium]|nr:membrane protein insertase YidC [Clostridia bacterium]